MRHIFRLFALMQRDGRNRIEIARRRVLSLFAPKLETEETPLADSGGRPLEVERRRESKERVGKWVAKSSSAVSGSADRVKQLGRVGPLRGISPCSTESCLPTVQHTVS